MDRGVRPYGAELAERFAAIGRGHDPESVGLERVDHRFSQCRLVIDDQDRSCHLPFRIAADVNGPLVADRWPRNSARVAGARRVSDPRAAFPAAP